MKERPILFRAPMVRAILEGSKTQTRRVIKRAHENVGNYSAWAVCEAKESGWIAWFGEPRGDIESFTKQAYDHGFPCPYGHPGDRLWVRETFVIENTREYHGEHEVPQDGRPIDKRDDDGGEYWRIPHYRATEPEPHIVPYELPESAPEYDDRTRWQPSIFMPRWASRIELGITGIRVERLQVISDEDSLAEGIYPTSTGLYPGAAKAEYKKLWESINGAGSWAANPWVWVVEFNKVMP